MTVDPFLFFSGMALIAASYAGLAATCYGYRSEVHQFRNESAELWAEFSKAKRKEKELQRRLERLERTGDTGPINLDRPTPAQRLAPTRPQLAARPQVPSGATAVAASGRGAHRMKR